MLEILYVNNNFFYKPSPLNFTLIQANLRYYTDVQVSICAPVVCAKCVRDFAKKLACFEVVRCSALKKIIKKLHYLFKIFF